MSCHAIFYILGFRNYAGVSSWDRMLAEIMQEQNAQTGICGSGCYVDVAGETHVLQRNEQFHHSSDPCRRYTCKVRKLMFNRMSYIYLYSELYRISSLSIRFLVPVKWRRDAKN